MNPSLPIGSVVVSKKTGRFAIVKVANPDGTLIVNLDDGTDRLVNSNMVDVFWVAPPLEKKLAIASPGGGA